MLAAIYKSVIPQSVTDKTEGQEQNVGSVVILEEEPYAWVLKSSSDTDEDYLGQRCTRCTGDKSSSWINCTKCEGIRYCSITCQAMDTAAHALECNGLASCTEKEAFRSRHARLIGRILSRYQHDKGYLPNDKWHGYKSRCLADLWSHSNEIKNSSDNETEFQWILSQYRKLFEDVPVLNSASDDRIREIYGKIITNAFSICDYDLQNGTFSIGTGLYINCSRFDHSCNPDLNYNFVGPKMTMKSYWPVQSGAQLYTKYIGSGIGSFAVAFTEERRKQLLENYWFHCECNFCSDTKRNTIMKTSLISRCLNQKCDSVAYISDKDEIICSNCEQPICTDSNKVQALRSIITSIEIVIKQSVEATTKEESSSDSDDSDEETESTKEKDPIEQKMILIAKVQKAANLARRVFHPERNVYLLRLHELLADLWRRVANGHKSNIPKSENTNTSPTYAKYKNAAIQAIKYGNYCLRSYSIYLQPISMWIGSLRYELGHLALGIDRLDAAMQYFKESRECWIAQCGEDHKCVHGLNKIIDDVSAKIRKANDM